MEIKQLELWMVPTSEQLTRATFHINQAWFYLNMRIAGGVGGKQLTFHELAKKFNTSETSARRKHQELEECDDFWALYIKEYNLAYIKAACERKQIPTRAEWSRKYTGKQTIITSDGLVKI